MFYKERIFYLIAIVLTMCVFFIGVFGCEAQEDLKPDDPEEVVEEVVFPTKTVRLLVGAAMGAGPDLEARGIQPYLQQALGVPVIVENIPGAGTSLAAIEMWKAEPDGHIIVVDTFPNLIIQEVGFDVPYSYRDFTFLGTLAHDEYVLAVKRDGKFKTIEDFVNASKERNLTVGVSGMGTTTHLVAELLSVDAGIDYTIIPYDGLAPALTAVLGGEIDATVAGRAIIEARLADYLPLITIAADRAPGLPDTPTHTEAGFNSRFLTQRRVFLGHHDLPEEYKIILREALEKTFANEEVIKWAVELRKIYLTHLTQEEFELEVESVFDYVEELAYVFE